jgi:MFS superfamily sulfate permease-like transporter
MQPFTLFRGMRPFNGPAIRRDAVAGVELAAMNIPQALGYTAIAGMPAVTGFYTLLLPLLAFATFGSSRFLVVAADSATAAILAGGISSMATPASAKYVALAGMVALLTAGFLLVARLLKLGFIADFLSRTVLVGFLTGVGFQVGIGVLGEMLGLEVHSRRTVVQLAQVVRDLSHVHLPSLALSAAVVASVLILGKLAPRIPGPLIAVAGAIAASAAWDFAARGIAIIGPVAGGLPHLGFPLVSWHEVQMLVPVAGS